jgi:crotonobetainyl-CoA:carnitine CoA-transferase CaiB-like acyl-CoA transferase
MGNQHPSIAPYETFHAKDGLVMVCAGNPKLWRQFCAALDRPDLPDDPRFAGNTERLQHRPALVAAIEARTTTWTVEEFVGRLEAAAVPYGRVRNVAEALADPQVTARALLVTQPHALLGEVASIGNPMKLSASPPSYRRPPPGLGEHTAEVLREVGYDDEGIRRVMLLPPA